VIGNLLSIYKLKKRIEIMKPIENKNDRMQMGVQLKIIREDRKIGK